MLVFSQNSTPFLSPLYSSPSGFPACCLLPDCPLYFSGTTHFSQLESQHSQISASYLGILLSLVHHNLICFFRRPELQLVWLPFEKNILTRLCPLKLQVICEGPKLKHSCQSRPLKQNHGKVVKAKILKQGISNFQSHFDQFKVI